MQSAIPLLVGLLLVALLTLVCSCHVEADVLETAQATLAENGLGWAHVEADGRWLTLTGTNPSPTRPQLPHGGILGAEAATRVVDNTQFRDLTVTDLNPVRAGMAGAGMRWVDLSWSEWTLELLGLAPSREDRDRAAEVAAPLWPWGPVDNQIRVPEADADRSAVGCRAEIDRMLDQETVQFETNLASLSAESQTLLRRFASILAGCPETRLAIEAHSDNTGNADYNLELSQARAESVVQFLVRSGVAADRLSATGYGETRPIATNETEAGKALNRRVEFRIR